MAADDPRIGRYRRSRGGDVVEIRHGVRGQMVLPDAENELVTGLFPLTDGSFLLPIYFQRCSQQAATRKVTCGMLSGDERYTTDYEPLVGRQRLVASARTPSMALDRLVRNGSRSVDSAGPFDVTTASIQSASR